MFKRKKDETIMNKIDAIFKQLDIGKVMICKPAHTNREFRVRKIYGGQYEWHLTHDHVVVKGSRIMLSNMLYDVMKKTGQVFVKEGEQ